MLDELDSIMQEKKLNKKIEAKKIYHNRYLIGKEVENIRYLNLSELQIFKKKKKKKNGW